MTMPGKNRWLLPEGIDELLPEQAWQLESFRRKLLDLCRSWGYDLVIPPLIEFLDSLQIGVGSDLDLKTFKLIDQLSGRLMGIRADMTPQVARIDAHRLAGDGVQRLCYLGSVLRTASDGFGSSRAPLQFGAEIYGHADVDSDVEILRLMLASLKLAGLEQVQLDLGHVGIFRQLSRRANLTAEDEGILFDALQRKARPEIDAFIQSSGLPADISAMISQLTDLTGGPEVFERAKAVLQNAGSEVESALHNLQLVANRLSTSCHGVSLYFDLAELRGFNFHTGVVFAAYIAGRGEEVARGGRYDGIGAAFGRARPATGFSADLKVLLQLMECSPGQSDRAIFAPWPDSPDWADEIERLRNLGERVICRSSKQDGKNGKKPGERWLCRIVSGFEIVEID